MYECILSSWDVVQLPLFNRSTTHFNMANLSAKVQAISWYCHNYFVWHCQACSLSEKSGSIGQRSIQIQENSSFFHTITKFLMCHFSCLFYMANVKQSLSNILQQTGLRWNTCSSSVILYSRLRKLYLLTPESQTRTPTILPYYMLMQKYDKKTCFTDYRKCIYLYYACLWNSVKFA